MRIILHVVAPTVIVGLLGFAGYHNYKMSSDPAYRAAQEEHRRQVAEEAKQRKAADEGSRRYEEARKREEEKKKKLRQWSPASGKEAVLRTEGGGEALFVAFSRAALDRLTQSSVRGDSAGVLEQIAAGEAAMIPVGTRVLVLDPGMMATEVRFMDGPKALKRAWIATDFLAPTPEFVASISN